jgi:hypothetical protein
VGSLLLQAIAVATLVSATLLVLALAIVIFRAAVKGELP